MVVTPLLRVRENPDMCARTIHPFPARMAPNIAIDHLMTAPEEDRFIVLDPMCGSGTVLSASGPGADRVPRLVWGVAGHADRAIHPRAGDHARPRQADLVAECADQAGRRGPIGGPDTIRATMHVLRVGVFVDGGRPFRLAKLQRMYNGETGEMKPIHSLWIGFISIYSRPSGRTVAVRRCDHEGSCARAAGTPSLWGRSCRRMNSGVPKTYKGLRALISGKRMAR